MGWPVPVLLSCYTAGGPRILAPALQDQFFHPSHAAHPTAFVAAFHQLVSDRSPLGLDSEGSGGLCSESSRGCHQAPSDTDLAAVVPVVPLEVTSILLLFMTIAHILVCLFLSHTLQGAFPLLAGTQ